MQSESLLSGFAEAQPIFERSSRNACLQSFCPFDNAKIGIKKYPTRMKKRVGKEWGNKRKNWGKNWGKLPLPVDTQEAFCHIYAPGRLRRIPVWECPIGEVA